MVCVFSDMIGNGMYVAIETDDDKGKNGQENTGQGQAGKAGKVSGPAVQSQLGRENQVTSAKVRSKEGKTQNAYIAETDGMGSRHDKTS